MAKSLTLRDVGREGRVFTARVLISVSVIILITTLLLARIGFVQIVNHAHYQTLSHENRVKIVPVPPTRGLIYSGDGVLIAENRPSFSLEIVPEQVPDLEEALAELRKIVTIEDSDEEQFRKALKQKRRFESIPLKINLGDEEVAGFSVNRHRFTGVDIVARLTRHYPLGPLAAHVVGYVGRIDENELQRIDAANYSASTHIGKIGVEKTYEDVLHGQVGYQQVEVNAQGRVIRVLQETRPVPGKDVHLMLDVSLQRVAMKALGDQRGAVAAIDPNTGGVLTLVSTPSFDPNPFVHGISSELYSKLRSSIDRPLYNRALQGQYPPGSTIKPFVGLAALGTGLRSEPQTSWCPGWYRLPGKAHRYRCWKKPGHKRLGLIQAIAQSCDVYFYRLAQDMGIDVFHDQLRQFGFGSPTGIDLSGESSGLLPSREWKQRVHRTPWYPGETVITAIGQGYMLTTPIQLAWTTATMANQGRRIPPRVVAKLVDPVNKLATKPSIETVSTLLSDDYASYWQTIISSMVEVVHGKRGTARHVGEKANYRFAGKTGTSQLFAIPQDRPLKDEEIEDRLRDHALFIAFAPAVKPAIAVAIVVENGGSGSSVAAPIARKLFDHYLEGALVHG